MKRTLLLMRHAKSSWETGAPTDHARPLNKRGRRDAPRIGTELSARGWSPGWVVCSDSARTRETWHRMAEHFPAARVRFCNGLYEGGLTELRTALSDVPSDVECVLALGHNPGWEDAAICLTTEGVRLATCNVAVLTGDLSAWSDLPTGGLQLAAVLRPKELAR